MKLIPYLIMAFLGLFIIVGVLFFLFAGTRDTKDVEKDILLKERVMTPKKEKEKEKESVDDKTLFREALFARDTELCSKVKDLSLQDECWDSILLATAIKDANSLPCKRIRSDNRKQYCSDQISLEIAVTQKDFSRCDDIKSTSLLSRCRDAQSRSKILQVTSVSDCPDIPTEKDRKLCQDFFMAKKIKQQENPKKSECKNFSTKEDQQKCELGIAVQKAEKELDTEPCRDFNDSDIQKTCLKQVQQQLQQNQSNDFMSAGDVEGCESFTDEDMRDYCRDRALSIRALKDYSPFVCYEIKNQQQKEICFDRATKAANTHFYKMAKDEKDPKWCQFVPNEEAKKSCSTIVSAIQ